MKQLRATIPTHLQSAFLEVGKQLNTLDPTVINTHILSCYFTGAQSCCTGGVRADSLKKTPPDQLNDFDDVADWTEEEI